ncbi:MAG: DUF5706 domain-containing protein [Tepidisphaeraceae bacterium]
MFERLDGVQSQIQFADSKAGIIAAALVTIFGFTMSHVAELRTAQWVDRHCLFWFGIVFLVVYTGCTIVGFVFAVLCVIPRLGGGAPACLFHFAHVTDKYKRNYDQFYADLVSVDAKSWASQITSQILVNCEIAAKKHRHVRRAIIWTVVSVIFWALALVMAATAGIAFPAAVQP